MWGTEPYGAPYIEQKARVVREVRITDAQHDSYVQELFARRVNDRRVTVGVVGALEFPEGFVKLQYERRCLYFSTDFKLRVLVGKSLLPPPVHPRRPPS